MCYGMHCFFREMSPGDAMNVSALATMRAIIFADRVTAIQALLFLHEIVGKDAA